MNKINLKEELDRRLGGLTNENRKLEERLIGYSLAILTSEANNNSSEKLKYSILLREEDIKIFISLGELSYGTNCMTEKNMPLKPKEFGFRDVNSMARYSQKYLEDLGMSNEKKIRKVEQIEGYVPLN